MAFLAKTKQQTWNFGGKVRLTSAKIFYIQLLRGKQAKLFLQGKGEIHQYASIFLFMSNRQWFVAAKALEGQSYLFHE